MIRILTMCVATVLVALIITAILGTVPFLAVGALVGALCGATLLGASIGAALGTLIVGSRVVYWYVQGFWLQNIGYIPPGPTTLERIIYYQICRIVLKLCLGPVKIIGQENCYYEGRLLVLPPHQHGFDFLIARLAVPWAFRQVGAAKEVKGWRAGLAAWSGTIAVPVVGGKSVDHAGSETVIHNAANLLIQSIRRRMLMFIQGRLVYDNVMREEECRTGAMRVMDEVDERTNHEPLGVLPMGIHYWTSEDCPNPNIGRRFMVWLWNKCFPDYGSGSKYGATVVIGKAIPRVTLAKDKREGTNQLCHVIAGYIEEAKRHTPHNGN